jgi:hypothetical protein
MTKVYQHNDYQIKKEIASIILYAGGHIFGGYVRDKLLHDSHAQKFYKKHGANSTSLYSDITINPELSGRFICPNDIDCYITQASLEKVLTNLSNAHMSVKKLFDHEPTKYLLNLNIPAGCMRYHRYAISIFNSSHIRDITVELYNTLHPNAFKLLGNHITTFLEGLQQEFDIGKDDKFAKIFIDVFCPVIDADFSKYEAPFSNLDFECNGLIYTQTGINMSRSIYNTGQIQEDTGIRLAISEPLNYIQRLTGIIDDIDNRVARIVNLDTSSRRIRKMVHKEWNIAGKEFFTVDLRTESSQLNESDSSCLICHENFNNKTPAFKLVCCEARYHLKCLVGACKEGVAAMQTSGKCVMCRKNTYIKDELPFLERYNHIREAYNIFIVERSRVQITLAVAPPHLNRVRRRIQNGIVALPVPIPILFPFLP